MKILAFTPTYNEAGNILPLIDELLALPLDLEVLVVDDRSPDGTWQMVGERARADRRVHLVVRDPPRGRGLAGRDGFRWFQDHPRFDALIEMDADFSHHPRHLPELVAALRDADAVIGSRFVAGGGEVGRSLARQWTSRLANAYLRFVLRVRVRDCTSGYRGFTRAAFAGIDFTRYTSVGPTIVPELLWDLRCRGRRIAEVPIRFEDRREGESKLHLGILIRSLIFPLQLRWRRIWQRSRGAG